MTKQPTNFRFTVNPEATASIHDDVIVIFHIGSGRLFTANSTGARIWRGIQQRLSLDAIVSEISEFYQIAYSTAREHIVRFLDELQRHALIQKEAEV